METDKKLTIDILHTLKDAEYWRVETSLYAYIANAYKTKELAVPENILEEYEISKNTYFSLKAFDSKKFVNTFFFGLEVMAIELFVLFYRNWEVAFKEDKHIPPEYRWIKLLHLEKHNLDEVTFERIKNKNRYLALGSLAVALVICLRYIKNKLGKKGDGSGDALSSGYRGMAEESKELRDIQKNREETKRLKEYLSKTIEDLKKLGESESRKKENIESIKDNLKTKIEENESRKTQDYKTSQAKASRELLEILGNTSEQSSLPDIEEESITEGEDFLHNISELLDLGIEEIGTGAINEDEYLKCGSAMSEEMNIENIEEKKLFLYKMAMSDDFLNLLRIFGQAKDIFANKNKKDKKSNKIFAKPENKDYSVIGLSRKIPEMTQKSLYMLSSSNPNYKSHALKQFANAGLPSYEKKKKLQKIFGHLMIFVDNSGSMRGGKESLAKALAALLCKQFEKKEQTALVAFFNIVVSFSFELKGNKDYLSVFNVPFTGGGTNFSSPLLYAIQRMRNDPGEYRTYDIVFLTDGVSHAQLEVTKEFLELRRELKVHCYCIITQEFYKPSSRKSLMARMPFVDEGGFIFLGIDNLEELNRVNFFQQ